MKEIKKEIKEIIEIKGIPSLKYYMIQLYHS